MRIVPGHQFIVRVLKAELKADSFGGPGETPSLRPVYQAQIPLKRPQVVESDNGVSIVKRESVGPRTGKHPYILTGNND